VQHVEGFPAAARSSRHYVLRHHHITEQTKSHSSWYFPPTLSRKYPTRAVLNRAAAGTTEVIKCRWPFRMTSQSCRHGEPPPNETSIQDQVQLRPGHPPPLYTPKVSTVIPSSRRRSTIKTLPSPATRRRSLNSASLFGVTFAKNEGHPPGDRNHSEHRPKWNRPQQ